MIGLLQEDIDDWDTHSPNMPDVKKDMKLCLENFKKNKFDFPYLDYFAEYPSDVFDDEEETSLMESIIKKIKSYKKA